MMEKLIDKCYKNAHLHVLKFYEAVLFLRNSKSFLYLTLSEFAI